MKVSFTILQRSTTLSVDICLDERSVAEYRDIRGRYLSAYRALSDYAKVERVLTSQGELLKNVAGLDVRLLREDMQRKFRSQHDALEVAAGEVVDLAARLWKMASLILPAPLVKAVNDIGGVELAYYSTHHPYDVSG